ncbi:MAG: DUF3634 family protein [Archangium sp.]|nr:DUF3634 family protein [Archangium sp.]
MQLLIILGVALALFLWFQRSTELFSLSWRNGELRLVRGRIPPMLRGDLAQALTQMKVERCTVTARREAQGARLSASGIDDFAAQRLRNIFQLYPVAQLRAAPAPAHGRLLRWFGLASLVWFFGRRDD